MRWHFRVDSPGGGAFNMAVDEALMVRAARTCEAVFRVYGWSSPTLSLGRNQRARGLYDEDAAQSLGVGFVRRPTGGRALMHHREVTYSVTMPLRDAGEAPRVYDFINDILLNALALLGVRAERATSASSLPPGPRPCFDVPAEREIVVGGRKLVGSAQWRHGGAMLQHGSILVRDDQDLIGRLTRTPQERPPSAATLSDELGRDPTIDEVADSARSCLESLIGAPTVAMSTDADLEHDLERLRSAYADETWTWRR